MIAFRRNRSALAMRGILPLLLATGLMGVPSAEAQITGIPALDRLPRYDWDVDPNELVGVETREIKQAYRRGIQDLKDGHCRDASSKFEFILGFIDDDPTIYYVAATAARCHHAFRAAAGYYESTIEFEPTNYDAYRFLGVSRLALGEVDEARDVLARLDLARLECEGACPPDLELAYAALRGALEVAKARAADD